MADHSNESTSSASAVHPEGDCVCMGLRALAFPPRAHATAFHSSCAVCQTPSSARSRVASSMIYARRPRHLRLSTRSIACALEVAWTTAPRSSSTVQLQSNRTGTNTTDTPSSIRLTSRWRSLYIRPQFVCRPSSADFTPESSTSCNQHFVTRHLVLVRQAAAMRVV